MTERRRSEVPQSALGFITQDDETKKKAYPVTVRGFGRVSTRWYEAASPEEARLKAMQANGVSIEVGEAKYR